MECVFCKIIKKELPADIVYEDKEVIAFRDINPKAPIHYLIVPKKHIESVNHLRESDELLVGKLIFTAQKIAKEKGIKAYNLLINVGREAGQVIDHLHLHFLAGIKKEISFK